MRQKLLVIGSNAFSAQDFIDLALDTFDGAVIGVSRSPQPAPFFLRHSQHKNAARFTFHQLDLNKNTDAIIDLCDREQPTHIVNFAAQSEVAPSWETPEHWYQTNTVALAQLVNHWRKQNYLQKYLHISSPEAYGSCSGNVTETTPDNPSTPYASSKSAADQLLRVFHKQFGFPVVFVRSTNVYGARQQLFKIIPRSVIYIKHGKKIQLHGGGVAVKSYIHIRDISHGEMAILQHGRTGELYHLSPDNGIAVRAVVEKICGLLNVDFASATEMVAERPGQDAAYVIDSTKARQAFNWRPSVDINTGLNEVVQWVNTNWTAISALPLSYQHRA